jgi:hypothetical protein
MSIKDQLGELDGAWEDKAPEPDSDKQNWWAVDSSKGDQEYHITDGATGHCAGWCCTCPHHWHRHAECKHIKLIKVEEQAKCESK